MLENSYSIDVELYNYIRKLLPDKSTILEFGSGEGTGELAKYYNMISVEHDETYVGKYNSQYIHAPLKQCKPHGKFPKSNTWYDARAIEKGIIGKTYDLMLIDGPPGPNITRPAMFKYRNLFNWNIPVIFDDAGAGGVYSLIVTLCKYLQKPEIKIYSADKKKAFAVI